MRLHRIASTVAAIAVVTVGIAAVSSSAGTTRAVAVPGLGNPTSALCPTGKQYTIGFDNWSDVQAYAVGLRKSLEQAAKKVGCVKIITRVDNVDPATALANVQSFVRQKVDAVMLFQILQAAMPGIMRAVDKAGIPAVATITPAPGATFVSLDPSAAGALDGQALAAALAKRNPSAKPWILLGNDQGAGDYSKSLLGGIVKAIKAKFPGIPNNQIITVETKSKPDVAFRAAKDVVTKFPSGAPILLSGVNDEIVGSMFRVLKQAGHAKDTLVMGIGGLYPLGVQNVCVNPEYVGTVDFLPETQGDYFLPVLMARIKGLAVPKSISTPIVVLDKAAAAKKYPNLAACK